MSQCEKDGRWSSVNLTCTAVLPTKEKTSSAEIQELTRRNENITECIIVVVVIIVIIMLLIPSYIVHRNYRNKITDISAINTVKDFPENDNTSDKVSIDYSVDNKTCSATGRQE